MKRDYFIDYAKAFLIPLVIIGHILYIYVPNDYPFDLNITSNRLIEIIESVIYSFHMSAFFLISGYLSKYSMDKYDFASFTKKVVKRLVIPFIFFKYFLLQPVHLWINPDKYGDFGASFFINYISDTSFGHLWFLVSLTVFQFFSYFIYHYLWRNKIIKFLLFGFLLIATFNSVVLSSWLPIMSGTVNNILKYFIYYVAGIELNTVINKVNNTNLNRLPCIVGVGGGIAIFVIYIDLMLSNSYFSTFTRLYLTFLYLLIIYVKFGNHLKESRIVAYINKLSMPLYLWHQLFIFIFLKIWNPKLGYTGLYIICCLLFAVVLSILSSTIFSILNISVLDGGIKIYQKKK